MIALTAGLSAARAFVATLLVSDPETPSTALDDRLGGSLAPEADENVRPAENSDPLAGAEGLDPRGMVESEQAAYELYLEGVKAYEATRFSAAKDAFERAARTLPDLPPYGRSRGALGLWLARCHARLYEESGELQLLELESALLHAYRSRLREAATDGTDRTHKQALVEQRLEELAHEQALRTEDHGDLETQLARSIRGEYDGAKVSRWSPTMNDLAWHFRPDDPRPRTIQQDESERVGPDALGPTESVRRPGTGLIVGGTLGMVAGVAGLGVMAVGMTQAASANGFDPADDPASRRAQIARGERGNAMAVVGVVAGSALLVSGAILVGLGVKKRRATQATAQLSVGPTGALLGVRGRF